MDHSPVRDIVLSMGFSRQEYWSGLPCPPPGDLPHPGIKPVFLISPALAGKFFTTSPTWEADECGSILYRESLRPSLVQSEHSTGDSPYSGPYCDLRHHWLLQRTCIRAGDKAGHPLTRPSPASVILNVDRLQLAFLGQKTLGTELQIPKDNSQNEEKAESPQTQANGHTHKHMATFIAYGHTSLHTHSHTHF